MGERMCGTLSERESLKGGAFMRRFRFAALALLATAALGLAREAGAAPAKNYYFPDVRIEIRIAADGSFAVEERRTFAFQGRFTWASMWIPARYVRGPMSYRVKIEDFTVEDRDGTPLRTEISDGAERFEAKWYYSAGNERRTFLIRYRVRGAVFSYPDVTEIYWQAIGGGWTKPTQAADITVHLPAPVADRSDILIYGHGPLSGRSEIVDASTARFTATNVKAGQYLEIRMAWPTGLVAGVPSADYTRASLRDEEARRVQQTIADLERERAGAERRARMVRAASGLWLVALVLVPLLWLPFFVRTWRRVGQDHRFAGLPDYAREPASDLPPALVELLLKEGVGITSRSFTATIFDLARRGWLEIQDQLVEKKHLFGKSEEYETTIILKKAYADDRELKAYEINVLDLLFEGLAGGASDAGARLTVDELKSYLKRNPQKFRSWYEAWTKSVKAEGAALGFIEPASLRARNVFLIVTAPLALLTLNPILLVFALSLVPTLKRRALPWARENEQWKAFRRFLRDFSHFRDIPPEAYKLWEFYLVFGILFGFASRILKALPDILRSGRAAAPGWYTGVGHSGFSGPGGLEHMIASINAMSTSIQTAASYSSGGGGGFSGGGAGGAGGGGGGAG